MTGTISDVHRERGIGHILGADGKVYLFRRNALQDAWFHELQMGDAVTFEPGADLRATLVRRTRD
jgi:hypothetical protein